MLDGPLVFVDVDTQRDFLEPDGALAIPGAEAILPNLARLTAFARRQGIPVLATACLICSGVIFGRPGLRPVARLKRAPHLPPVRGVIMTL